MKKRRLVSTVLAAALLISTVTGCGGSSSGTDSTTQAAQAGNEAADSAVEADVNYKDTLIVAKSEDITSLDPTLAMNQKSFTIFSQIYEGLVEVDPESGKVVPLLATGWEQLNDTQWRFELREGVKFHDGTDLTSEDVVYSFERLQACAGPSAYVTYLDKIEADGDYAVIMTTVEPYAQIIEALSFPCAVIVSKDAVEEAGEDFAQSPVGCGPYQFVERVAAESITLKAFDEYWDEKAKTENLIFKIIPEASQRTVMLETGEVDIACDILPNDAPRVDEDENLQLIRKTGNKYYSIYWGTESETPVGKKEVRQALTRAIDKQVLVDIVMNGYGEVGSLMVSPTVYGYNAEKDQGNLYNVEEAKKMLADAGYADGFTFDAYVRTGQTYEELATVVQDQFKQVGVTMNITVMESNAITEMKNRGEDVPLDFGFYNNICGDQEFRMVKLLPGTLGVPYNNPYMTELVSKVRGAANEEERQAGYDEFHDIMQEDYPETALFYEEILVGLTNGVDGFSIHPMGAHQYSEVSVAE